MLAIDPRHRTDHYFHHRFSLVERYPKNSHRFILRTVIPEHHHPRQRRCLVILHETNIGYQSLHDRYQDHRHEYHDHHRRFHVVGALRNDSSHCTTFEEN